MKALKKKNVLYSKFEEISLNHCKSLLIELYKGKGGFLVNPISRRNIKKKGSITISFLSKCYYTWGDKIATINSIKLKYKKHIEKFIAKEKLYDIPTINSFIPKQTQRNGIDVMNRHIGGVLGKINQDQMKFIVGNLSTQNLFKLLQVNKALSRKIDPNDIDLTGLDDNQLITFLLQHDYLDFNKLKYIEDLLGRLYPDQLNAFFLKYGKDKIDLSKFAIEKLEKILDKLDANQLIAFFLKHDYLELNKYSIEKRNVNVLKLSNTINVRLLNILEKILDVSIKIKKLVLDKVEFITPIDNKLLKLVAKFSVKTLEISNMSIIDLPRIKQGVIDTLVLDNVELIQNSNLVQMFKSVKTLHISNMVINETFIKFLSGISKLDKLVLDRRSVVSVLFRNSMGTLFESIKTLEISYMDVNDNLISFLSSGGFNNILILKLNTIKLSDALIDWLTGKNIEYLEVKNIEGNYEKLLDELKENPAIKSIKQTTNNRVYEMILANSSKKVPQKVQKVPRINLQGIGNDSLQRISKILDDRDNINHFLTTSKEFAYNIVSNDKEIVDQLDANQLINLLVTNTDISLDSLTERNLPLVNLSNCKINNRLINILLKILQVGSVVTLILDNVTIDNIDEKQLAKLGNIFRYVETLHISNMVIDETFITFINYCFNHDNEEFGIELKTIILDSFSFPERDETRDIIHQRTRVESLFLNELNKFEGITELELKLKVKGITTKLELETLNHPIHVILTLLNDIPHNTLGTELKGSLKTLKIPEYNDMSFFRNKNYNVYYFDNKNNKYKQLI
jgi:hypothetical protein